MAAHGVLFLIKLSKINFYSKNLFELPPRNCIGAFSKLWNVEHNCYVLIYGQNSKLCIKLVILAFLSFVDLSHDENATWCHKYETI